MTIGVYKSMNAKQYALHVSYRTFGFILYRAEIAGRNPLVVRQMSINMNNISLNLMLFVIIEFLIFFHVINESNNLMMRGFC